MHRRSAPAVLVAVVSTLLVSCGDGEDYESGSAEVEGVAPTEVRAGNVTVVLEAGAATGGTLEVQQGPPPADVPVGVVPIGSSAEVSLPGGTLDGAMRVSFDPPAALAPEHVPIVMARDDAEEWRWLPTSWDEEQQVAAELEAPGELFLARFDSEPWLEEHAAEFARAASTAKSTAAPTCGDEETVVADGLQVTAEAGDLVRWCAGVDTIEPNDNVADADVDPYAEGIQAPVLRVLNSSRLYKEVGFPEEWVPVDGSGRSLRGQELRHRLGLAGKPRAGLATRVLPPGEALTLLLADAGPETVGTVTVDLSAAAWTLSALDDGSSTYAELVTGVDAELGEAAWQARKELKGALTGHRGPAPEELSECLAPVAEVIVMDRDAAEQLLTEAFACVPPLLRPALGADHDAAPMADGVAASVLEGLPATLHSQEEPWTQVSDAMTDPDAGVQLRVGPPPAEEHDYTVAPHVFRPGDEVDVAEWSPEFTAYVEGRLDQLLATAGSEPDGPGAGTCSDGTFTVHRYRTDGFALAEEVGCTGDPWRLVLGRTDAGWQEIDDIQQDPYFGCSVLGTYSVPVSIAGEMCLDGDQPQEYPE